VGKEGLRAGSERGTVYVKTSEKVGGGLCSGGVGLPRCVAAQRGGRLRRKRGGGSDVRLNTVL